MTESELFARFRAEGLAHVAAALEIAFGQWARGGLREPERVARFREIVASFAPGAEVTSECGASDPESLARAGLLLTAARKAAEAAPGSPVPVLRQTRTADGASVLVPAYTADAMQATREPVLVANTTRACYWHFPATGLYNAFKPDVTPTPDHGKAGYPRLDSIMRLKGEAEHYIATACNELGRHKESI